MDVHKPVCRFEKHSAHRFQSQISRIKDFDVWVALEQIDRELMQRGIYEAEAFVGQHISVWRVGKLGFVVGYHIFEKASQLFAALIRDFSEPTDVKVATPQVDWRCLRVGGQE